MRAPDTRMARNSHARIKTTPKIKSMSQVRRKELSSSFSAFTIGMRSVLSTLEFAGRGGRRVKGVPGIG